jgi:hypothetical protein
MKRTQTKRTGSFIASGDDGKTYAVVEFTDFHQSGTHADGDSWTPGLKAYKLPDGTDCNPLDDGRLEIATNRVKLTPSASTHSAQ